MRHCKAFDDLLGEVDFNIVGLEKFQMCRRCIENITKLDVGIDSDDFRTKWRSCVSFNNNAPSRLYLGNLKFIYQKIATLVDSVSIISNCLPFYDKSGTSSKEEFCRFSTVSRFTLRLEVLISTAATW